MKFLGNRTIREAPLVAYALSIAGKESSSQATEKAAEHAGWDSSAKVKGKVFCKQRAQSRLSFQMNGIHSQASVDQQHSNKKAKAL